MPWRMTKTELGVGVPTSCDTTTDTAVLTKPWSLSPMAPRFPLNVMMSSVGPLRVGACVTGAAVLGDDELVGE